MVAGLANLARLQASRYCSLMLLSGRTFRLPPAIKSLSARLLILTIFFVMLSELFVFAPSVARYRKVYLEDRIADGHLSIATLEGRPDQFFGPDLEMEVLRQARSRQIVLARPGQPKIMLMLEGQPMPDVKVDLREQSFTSFLFDAFETLFQTENRLLLVTGQSPHDPDVRIEVMIDETPMRLEMYDYSERILQLSIVISLFTATLVYLSLQLMLVYPMRRMTENIVRFSEDPENPGTTIEPSGRGDEIGVTEHVLSNMQASIRRALRERTRLAALGAAVTKINHDLRNILAPAQLLSDRLVGSDDPEIKRIAPRLVSAIDRAVDLSVQTLDFSRSDGPPLSQSRFGLSALVDEVWQSLAQPGRETTTALNNRVDAATEATADRDQIYRVLDNLCRNAIEAGAQVVTISAESTEDFVRVQVHDDGPGIPQDRHGRLFEAFGTSGRQGGTGLGLAISNELVRAHGGRLTLEQSGPDGTTFQLTLPAG